MCAILISKALRLARVNEGSHTVLRATDTFIHMERAILPLLPSHRASPQCGRYSFPVPPRVGGWVLSWRKWFGEILRWFARLWRRSPIPVLAARRPGIELATVESQVQRANHHRWKNVPQKIKKTLKNVTKIKKNVCKRWIKNVSSNFPPNR